VHTLELPKVPRDATQLKSPLESWGYFLCQAESLEPAGLPEPLNRPAIHHALEELVMLSEREIERERYEARFKRALDERSRQVEAERLAERVANAERLAVEAAQRFAGAEQLCADAVQHVAKAEQLTADAVQRFADAEQLSAETAQRIAEVEQRMAERIAEAQQRGVNKGIEQGLEQGLELGRERGLELERQSQLQHRLNLLATLLAVAENDRQAWLRLPVAELARQVAELETRLQMEWQRWRDQ